MFFPLLRRSTPVTMAYLQPPRRFQDCFTCHLDLARTKPALQGTIQNTTGFKACGFLGRCDCNHRSITNTCASWPSLRMVFSYGDPLGGRGCGGVSLTDTRRNFSAVGSGGGAGDSAKGNRLSLHKKVQRPPNRFLLPPPSLEK